MIKSFSQEELGTVALWSMVVGFFYGKKTHTPSLPPLQCLAAMFDFKHNSILLYNTITCCPCGETLCFFFLPFLLLAGLQQHVQLNPVSSRAVPWEAIGSMEAFDSRCQLRGSNTFGLPAQRPSLTSLGGFGVGWWDVRGAERPGTGFYWSACVTAASDKENKKMSMSG